MRIMFFCVADGITRDPKKPLDFGTLSMKELLKNYPHPSPARMTADCFCQSFVTANNKKINSEKGIIQAFALANERIRELNEKSNPEPDCLVNDLYGRVASVCVIAKDNLFWGFIGDCGLAIFKSNGMTRFITPNGLENFKQYVSRHTGLWRKPERRKYIRSKFRNNSKKIENGKCVAYGALTGEAAAVPFIQTGCTNIDIGDIAVLYTDGFMPALEQPQFYENISRVFSDKDKFTEFNRKLANLDHSKFGKEKTLLAVKI